MNPIKFSFLLILFLGLEVGLYGQTDPKDDQATALFDACEKGNLKKVKQILKNGGDPNRRPLEKTFDVKPKTLSKADALTPFTIAVANGHYKLSKYLIEKGASLKLYAPLNFAVLSGKVKMVELLLKSGTRLDQSDFRHHQPLENAIINSNLKITEYLLSDTVINNNLRRGLFLSINENEQAIFKLLLSKADSAFIRLYRYDLIAAAIKLNNQQALAELKKLPNPKDDVVIQSFALEYAIKNHQNDKAIDLIKKGADIHLFDPILTAVKSGNLQLVQLLHRKGVMLNSSERKYDLMYHALYKGNNKVTQYLLENDAVKEDDFEEIYRRRKKGKLTHFGYQFHYELYKGNEQKCIDLLKENPDSVFSKKSYKSVGAPFSEIAKRGYWNLAEYIIDHYNPNFMANTKVGVWRFKDLVRYNQEDFIQKLVDKICSSDTSKDFSNINTYNYGDYKYLKKMFRDYDCGFSSAIHKKLGFNYPYLDPDSILEVRRKNLGKPIWEGELKNGKRHGKWSKKIYSFVYFPSYTEYGNYTNGFRDGKWVEGFESDKGPGEVFYGVYKNGKREGEWIFNAYDGEYDYTCYSNYKNGKLNGEYYCKEYVDESDEEERKSRLAEKGQYKNGFKVGEWKMYQYNKDVICKGNYSLPINGDTTAYQDSPKKPGDWNSFHTCYFGLKDGVWKYYDVEGKLKGKEEYQKGKPIGVWEYESVKGKIIATHNNDTSTWTLVRKDGEQKTMGIEVDGKKEGYWTFYLRDKPEKQLFENGYRVDIIYARTGKREELIPQKPVPPGGEQLESRLWYQDLEITETEYEQEEEELEVIVEEQKPATEVKQPLPIKAPETPKFIFDADSLTIEQICTLRKQEAKKHKKNFVSLKLSYNQYDYKGQIHWTISYSNGVKHGEEVSYHYGYQLAYKKTYFYGSLDGKVEEYYSNGQKSLEAFYKNGTLHGKYIEYNRKGQIRTERHYENGVLVFEK